MADYKVYGYAAYEVEVHNHIKKRVIFAISMAHRPHWLCWYITAVPTLVEEIQLVKI